MTGSMQGHFERVAPSYDELRAPVELHALDALIAAGDLAGRRVLDIGCGTGRALTALAAQHGVEGWGVDRSNAMIETARGRVPQSVRLQVGAAEDLPFPDCFFPRAFMTLVVQHLDRPRAFREIRRILEPGGRLTIQTLDPDTIASGWMAPLFPSYVEVEQRRFPGAGVLQAELEEAGFARTWCFTHHLRRSLSKRDALETLRGRAYSTFALLDADEIAEGIERAERMLTDPVEYTLELLLITGIR